MNSSEKLTQRSIRQPTSPHSNRIESQAYTPIVQNILSAIGKKLIRTLTPAGRALGTAATASFILNSGCSIQYGDDKQDSGWYATPCQEIPDHLEETILTAIEENKRITADNDLCETTEQNCLNWSQGPKEYFEKVLGFAGTELQSEGYHFCDLNHTTVDILPYKEIKDICGSGSNGCHFDHGAIFLSETFRYEYFPILFHEYGHEAQPTIDNNENVSMAWEIYGSLYSFILSQKSGAALLKNVTLPHSIGSLTEKGTDNEYTRGTIFGLQNLIDHQGDLNAATNYAQQAKLGTTEETISHTIEEMEKKGITRMADIWVELWNELLKTPHFLVNERLTPAQTQEARDYLKAQIEAIHSEYNKDDTQAKEDHISALEDHANNPENTNPYLKAKIITALSEELISQLIDSLSTYGKSSDQVLELADHIIELNTGYPCAREVELPQFQCPLEVSLPQIPYTHAHFYLADGLQTRGNLEFSVNDWESSILITDDFFATFYPSNNNTAIHTTVSQNPSPQLDNLVPMVAYKAGEGYRKLENPETAEYFYNIAFTHPCREDGSDNQSGVPHQTCEDYKTYTRLRLKDL